MKSSQFFMLLGVLFAIAANTSHYQLSTMAYYIGAIFLYVAAIFSKE
jgi:hypothetical protein